MKHQKKIFRLLPLLLASLFVSGCAERLYEEEGDCSVAHLVSFRYDYNMKWADAFAHEVESVTLYVLDSNTKEIVWQKTEAGAVLASGSYMMEINVPRGTYDLLVWAGSGNNNSWNVPVGVTMGTDLTCTLSRKYDSEGNAYTDNAIDRLYHGYLANQTLSGKRGVQTYTVPLVKDTNEVRVVLQHTSVEEMDTDKFTFSITDDNGSMGWDNSVLSDETITYYAWHTEQGEAEFDTKAADTKATQTKASFGAAIAELTTARLMESHRNGTRLTVKNNQTDETVLSIPLVQIATMVKGYYNSDMDNQEYLDRQDEYSLVFFLDEGDRWIDNCIYINSWKVVLQSTGL